MIKQKSFEKFIHKRTHIRRASQQESKTQNHEKLFAELKYVNFSNLISKFKTRGAASVLDFKVEKKWKGDSNELKQILQDFEKELAVSKTIDQTMQNKSKLYFTK